MHEAGVNRPVGRRYKAEFAAWLKNLVSKISTKPTDPDCSPLWTTCKNVTVDGGITGFGLDLGIIDDPFKGRADADSRSRLRH
jgi:hypothetical protein